jgi:hypothetical protein
LLPVRWCMPRLNAEYVESFIPSDQPPMLVSPLLA